jgi:ATP-dependent Clp protease protease subunit
MEKTKIVLSLICIGVLVGCSDASTGEEVKSLKVISSIEKNSSIDTNSSNKATKDRNLTKESKSFKEEIEKLENKQKKLEILSSLDESSLKNSNKKLLEELQKIKWEKEILEEKFELQKLKDEKSTYLEEQKYAKEKRLYEIAKERYEYKRGKLEQEVMELEHNASLAEIKMRKYESEVALVGASKEYQMAQLESKIALLKKQNKVSNYILEKPEYTQTPLSLDKKTLIISDRRIALNGVIDDDVADEISNEINYFNNKDSKKPIFIVIDKSSGGSAMAGYKIIEAMKSSRAPIYVVLKTYAASMTAIIVTLADKSFAYPGAMMIHHQPMTFQYGRYNLTEQKESYESLERWWKVFGEPIAKKMGMELEEFREEMYRHSSHGDWSEFASEAQKLKWVNNIVERIEERSVVLNPTYKEENEQVNEDESSREMLHMTSSEKHSVKTEFSHKKVSKQREQVGADGKPFIYMKRLSPEDSYFIYDPNGYYRVR